MEDNPKNENDKGSRVAQIILVIIVGGAILYWIAFSISANTPQPSPSTSQQNVSATNGATQSAQTSPSAQVAQQQPAISGQINQQENQTQPVSPQQDSDLPSIISLWTPNVAYIDCQFRYAQTGQLYLEQSGSGFLVQLRNDPTPTNVYVDTNKHVVLDSNGNGPTSCFVSLPNGSSYTIPNGYIRVWTQDFAELQIPLPDAATKELASQTLTAKLAYCEEAPQIGASVVILGYPGIGASTGITATQGIISGLDGNYYVTSAKVGHGNSGGVAILYGPQGNCYLGIPTFAETDSIESLARILMWTAVYQ
jgi:hypothetical protein